MNYNFTPKLISGNIYDCPFYLHCPTRLCEIEGGIEERCLIIEKGIYQDLCLKEGEVGDDDCLKESDRFWF
jgi:hypothetical protein